MQLPAELTLSERVALELGGLAVPHSEELAAPLFELTTSNVIATIAALVALGNVGYTIFSGVRRRQQEDRRYDFDTQYGGPIQSSLLRLDNAIDVVSQAAAEPSAQKRTTKISELQRTLLNPWYFALDGLLYESSFGSANLVLGELVDFWDVIGLSLNSISDASFSTASSDAVFTMNRAAQRFRTTTLTRVLADRRKL